MRCPRPSSSTSRTWLNLYLYPAEIDYARGTPLGSTWHRLDTCVATPSRPCSSCPREIAEGEGALVYLSLGSLGSADVDLMRRLVDVLSRAPHRFIVSKGPQASEFELADNMWGDEFLPQPALLPLADLVITHGGNNTTTECFHFGKPMIALPLFWDQYDNAQRVDETGFGDPPPDVRVRGRRAARRDRSPRRGRDPDVGGWPVSPRACKALPARWPPPA